MTPSVTLGTDTATREEVILSQEARSLSVYILGIRQHGKSNLLEHVALQDIDNGDGLCFIDPLGKSADKLVRHIPERRRKDVVFWDIADDEHPFGFNPFFCLNIREIDKKADEFLSLLHNLEEFREAFKSGNRMNEVLYHLAVTFLVKQGSTLAEMGQVLRDKEYRKAFLAALTSDHFETDQFWKTFASTVPASSQDAALNKISRFLRSRTMRGIFGQPTNSIDWRLAMDEGKIIIVRLTDEVGREDASFIGAYTIWDIARSMYGRKNRRPFHIIVDEFSRYMTNTFSRIHDEGGNFGLDVIVAHQHRNQMDDDEIKGSTLAVGNKIVFRVSGKDGKELSQEFKLEIPEGEVREQQKYALPSNVLEYLASGRHEDPTVIEIYKKLSLHLDQLDIWILNAMREDSVQIALRWAGGKKVSEQQFDRQEYDKRNEVFVLRKKELEHVLDRILYFMMSTQDEKQSGKWSTITPQDILSNAFDQLYQVGNLGGRWFPVNHYGYVFYIQCLRDWRKKRRRFSDDLNAEIQNYLAQYGYEPLLQWVVTEKELCRKEYSQMPMRQNETSDRIPLKWEIAFTLDEWETHLRALVMMLGCLLHDTPGYISVGQLEQVKQAERTYSDVGNQMADMLSTLPRYVAYCTLVQNRKVAQYKIDTLNPLGEGDIRTGKSIRKRSRLRYGRERGAVEAAIRERLGIVDNPTQSKSAIQPVTFSRAGSIVPSHEPTLATLQSEPAPPQWSLERDTDYYEDDGDIVTDE